MRSADGVIWAFPLYILLVCSQYKRFIELVEERGAASAFPGKHAVTLSTSINYFDSNAHTYMRSVCEDLGMRFVGRVLRPHARPHEREKSARAWRVFAAELFGAIHDGAEFPRTTAVLPAAAVRPSVGASTGRHGRDCWEADRDPHRHEARAGEPARHGGSPLRRVGRPGARGQPVRPRHQGRVPRVPALRRFLPLRLHGQGRVHRFLHHGPRPCGCHCFCRGHSRAASFRGNGASSSTAASSTRTPRPWSASSLPSWLRGRSACCPSSVTPTKDGPSCSAPTSRRSSPTRATRACLMRRWISWPEGWCRLSEAAYVAPRTFLGVAGMKIFRDDIWSELRIVFRADHKAYKRMGFYDFPQKRIGHRVLMGLAWLVTGLPGIRAGSRP